jgi:hypothetical protein
MLGLCNSISELDDFIAFVVLYAPDQFLARHNMDLKKAFMEINTGLDRCSNQIDSKQKLEELKKIVSDSEAAYMRNDVVKGAHLLQDMVEMMKR